NWLRVLGLEHLLDDPSLATMPDLLPSQEALEHVRGLIADAMATRTLDEWLDIFLREDVGGDPFLTAEEYLQHPQATENGRTVVIDDPVLGRTTQIGPLGVFSETPSVIGKPAPALGADTVPVLRSLPRRGTTPPMPPATATPRRRPFEDVTVLELGYFYAAPFAMTLLAELGARVIKVEPPTGDPARRNWVTDYDKETVGKESIVADLKTPEGLRIVHQLAERADVLLHNFRPGVPERLRIDPGTMLEINPRLVYVYGGAFGSKGPWARKPGFHSSPNAIAGVGIIEAGAGNPPVNRTYADPAGALATAVCTLIALHARERTGKGQYVETTMLSSMAYAVSGWSITYPGKEPGPLPDSGQHGFHALHRLYDTGDGWLFLECETDAQWAALVETLGMPELAHDPRFADRVHRRDHDEELAALLHDALEAAPASQWEIRLLAAGVPAVRADGIDLFDFMLNHPHMRENGLSVPARLADGTEFWRSAGCVEFSHLERRLGDPQPLGASTERILRELGYSDAEIADLEARGVTRAIGHGLDAPREVANQPERPGNRG
ncbi:MAG TPA: CoA transferase, partial [Acidimicrobiales bacterium]